jgi:tRNA(Ile)-lysidine synthase
MIQKNDKIIVGVSGGADSLALLHILNMLSKETGFSIICVHVNHCLRGEYADQDEAFVKETCQEWGVPCFTKKIDVAAIAKKIGISVEEAGRNARYEYFNEIKQKENADKIAVAHNANDNAETVLMRIIRGTGVEGLSGIRPVREGIIRPLIEVERSLIEEYCSENKLAYRVDNSNFENKYTRNKIRLELIPYLADNFNPKIIQSVNRLSKLASLDNDYINYNIGDILNEVITVKEKEYIKIDFKKLSKYNPNIYQRILRKILSLLYASMKDIESVNLQSAADFITSAKNGSIYELPNGLVLRKNYNHIDAFKKAEIDDNINYEYSFEPEKEIYIKEADLFVNSKILDVKDVKLKTSIMMHLFDIDKLPKYLKIRNRKDGDIIYPSGMTGKRNLRTF